MTSSRHRLSIQIFLIVSVLYGLVAWDRILEPSPHFHFVDLAHSFLEGRFDTDTPRLRSHSKDVTPGLREAVARATTGRDGKRQGWNDWASYFELTLRENGQVVQGVWPWKDQEGRNNEFHTLDGTIRYVDRWKDVATTCEDRPRNRCIREVFQVSFPPFPAIAILPAVGIWGYHFNDVLFTVILSGLNAALFFLWLTLLVDRGHSGASVVSRLWLTAFFAFGTAVFFSSVRGEVWFMAQIMGCTLHLLFLMAALDARYPWLAGLALACGFATRTPLVFTSLFFGLQAMQCYLGSEKQWKRLLVALGQFGTPCLVAGTMLLWMNDVRWGNPGEFGHTYLAEGTRASIRDYGLFHPHFLERNLRVFFTHVPSFTEASPYVQISKHGLGFFVASPFFLWLLRMRKGDRLTLSLAATALVVLVPALFYQNTGWEQFSYRFSIDALPLLGAILVIQHPIIGGWGRGLIGVSILIQLFGAIVFGRYPQFFGG